MIEYIANFYGADQRPYICKKFTSSSNEELHTALNFENRNERDEMTAELIYEHLDNLLKYIQQFSNEKLSIIQLDEPILDNPWPVKGWPEVDWALGQIIQWWNYVYYKNASSDGTIYFNHGHSATEDDHTHDPVTGETIPNSASGVPAGTSTAHSHDDLGAIVTPDPLTPDLTTGGTI